MSTKKIVKVVGCKAFKLGFKTGKGAKLAFTSSNTKVATVGKVSGKVTVKKTGTTRITALATPKGGGSKTKLVVTLRVLKKNTLTAAAKTVNVLKSSKAVTIEAVDAFTVKDARGKVAYKKLSGNKKISISNKGTVKVKKGLKANRTYKVKVRVKAAGNKSYAPASKVVTLKVKVKKRLADFIPPKSTPYPYENPWSYAKFYNLKRIP